MCDPRSQQASSGSAADGNVRLLLHWDEVFQVKTNRNVFAMMEEAVGEDTGTVASSAMEEEEDQEERRPRIGVSLLDESCDTSNLLNELEEEIRLSSPPPAVVEVSLVSEIDSMFGGDLKSKSEELQVLAETTEAAKEEEEEEEEASSSPEALREKLKGSEVERDALAKEVLEKDEALGALERKLAQSLAESAAKQEEHNAQMEEAERRQRQLQEETGAKIAEVINHDLAAFFSRPG